MSSPLVDSVKTAFTDLHLSKFAALLGETEGSVQKAVHAAISLVLTDILHKAYVPAETAKVRNLSVQAASGDFFGHLHELSTGSGGLVAGSALLNKGTDFSRSLLSPRADNVVHEISRFAGISVPSASFITGLASFASLDAIGRHIASSNADTESLSAWIKSQSESIMRAIPMGLQGKPALGLQYYPWERPANKKQNAALYVVVALIVIGLIAIFIYRNRQQTVLTGSSGTTDTLVTNSGATPPAPSSDTTVNSSAVSAAASPIKVSLPNGQKIDAYKGGTEDRLVSFLGDPNAEPDKKNGNWFDFTQVSFASNSSGLLPESETQLKNIVAILDAFPKAKIKIGGYTDNTGDASANLRLSRQRADNILAKLKDFGAKPGQLAGAAGYGSSHPVGDNNTSSGRAMNRRMSINVKAK